jgi:hypothetical protein
VFHELSEPDAGSAWNPPLIGDQAVEIADFLKYGDLVLAELGAILADVPPASLAGEPFIGQDSIWSQTQQ